MLGRIDSLPSLVPLLTCWSFRVGTRPLTSREVKLGNHNRRGTRVLSFDLLRLGSSMFGLSLMKPDYTINGI